MVNLYHISNRINDNGGRVDIFINDIFDNICKCIKEKHQTLYIINKTISTQLAAFKSSTSDFIQNATCKSNSTEEGSVQTAVGSSTTCCTDLQRINSISEDNEGDELPQDTLKPTKKCPICLTYVNDGIACDWCDFWFHCDCVGITMKDAKLGLRDMDYICTMCSDDMLYEDRNIVESHGEFQDHTSTEYEVDKNTDSSKSLVSDTTHVKTPYNCDTVNVSTPDPTNSVQNTEQATSITQNTEHASE